MAAEENPKRKRSWSVFSWFLGPSSKRRRRVTDTDDEDSNSDLVSFVLNGDLDKLIENVAPPPDPSKGKHDDSVSREELVDENPLYVAAKLNFVEGARVLLDAGWKIADDRTALSAEDSSFPTYTPLGIALEKRNEVLALFLERVTKLEKLGLPQEKKLVRSWSVKKISASRSTENLADGEVDLVTLVLEDNTELLQKELKSRNIPKPNPVAKELTYADRLELVTDNPLYVAAKIGREKAAEILLSHNWKMTEDLTVGEEDESIPALTPLGVAYEKQNGVLDIFLNQILSLELAHPITTKKPEIASQPGVANASYGADLSD